MCYRFSFCMNAPLKLAKLVKINLAPFLRSLPIYNYIFVIIFAVSLPAGMYDAPYGVAQTVATVAVASYTHFPMPTPYKPPFVKPESHSSHPAYHPNAHATGAGSPWTTASPPGARHPHLPFHPCPPSAGPVSEDVYVGYKQTPSLSHIWPYQAGHSSSTPMRPYELFSQPPRAVIPFNLNGSSFRSSSGTSNTSSSGGERRLS